MGRGKTGQLQASSQHNSSLSFVFVATSPVAPNSLQRLIPGIFDTGNNRISTTSENVKTNLVILPAAALTPSRY